MKNVLFLILLSLVFKQYAVAQCVIYACDQTGAFGAGFNNDNQPTSMQECTDFAVRECKAKGGKDCTFLYKSTKAGWWAFVNGTKSDGRNYFQGGDGYATQAQAESAVRAKYKEGGGTNASTIKIYTWYVYSNPR